MQWTLDVDLFGKASNSAVTRPRDAPAIQRPPKRLCLEQLQTLAEKAGQPAWVDSPVSVLATLPQAPQSSFGSGVVPSEPSSKASSSGSSSVASSSVVNMEEDEDDAMCIDAEASSVKQDKAKSSRNYDAPAAFYEDLCQYPYWGGHA